MSRISIFVSALVSLAALASVDAFAENGVVEINQACASQSGASAGDDPGCFQGDTDGLPVEITQPGSYRLTGNLELAGGESAAIVVSASNVSLDLNGFSVSCSVTACPGGDGLPDGITGSGSNVAVRNGSITGMDGKGVYLSGDFARAEDVRAISNWGDGFHLGSKCVVNRSSAISNGGAGFRTTAPDCGGTANAAITNTGGDFVPFLPELDPRSGVGLQGGGEIGLAVTPSLLAFTSVLWGDPEMFDDVGSYKLKILTDGVYQITARGFRVVAPAQGGFMVLTISKNELPLFACRRTVFNLEWMDCTYTGIFSAGDYLQLATSGGNLTFLSGGDGPGGNLYTFSAVRVK